jgi:hypothetical protein
MKETVLLISLIAAVGLGIISFTPPSPVSKIALCNTCPPGFELTDENTLQAPNSSISFMSQILVWWMLLLLRLVLEGSRLRSLPYAMDSLLSRSIWDVIFFSTLHCRMMENYHAHPVTSPIKDLVTD